MPITYRTLPGSERSPDDASGTAIDDNARIEISLYLKGDRPSGNAPDATSERASRTALRDERERTLAKTAKRIADFAAAHHLTCMETDLARRRIRIEGRAADMQKAFDTQLHQHTVNNVAVCGRRGAIHLPADIVDDVEAVLGLDTAPIATPKIVPHRGANPPPGYLPTDVATLYDFPQNDVGGQCIAIIELGGGFTEADNNAAFEAMGLAVPPVVSIPVSGGANAPSDGSGADGEVALDIQVAGGGAPGATLAVYFAPNTSRGFVDAITQAVHDDSYKPSVISISWGSPEDGWAAQERTAMHNAFADAARLGVTICAASGDALATDGAGDGQAHVDYPASDPYVLGCGGTLISTRDGSLVGESVWNSNGGGTGGGLSRLYAQPAYQANADVPLSDNTDSPRRGVPDVAGDADPDSGYRIVTGARTMITGGTSAVAPLWAALIAQINAADSEPLGFAHARLYAATDAFRDITSGNNIADGVGYRAGPGWDACTGLGSPNGTALQRALASS